MGSLNGVSIEQLQGKHGRVITIQPGKERQAALVESRSGADVLPFEVGGDKLLLVGRGLKLNGLGQGMPVEFKGQSGVVTGTPTNRRNTFVEGLNRPLAKGAAIASTAIGLGMFILPWSFHLTVPHFFYGGLAIGAGILAASGLLAALKPVNLKAFDKATR